MDQRFMLLCHIQHISLSELARRSKITPGYLSKILSGKAPNVSLSILARISEQLNLSINELFKIIHEKDYIPEICSDRTNPGYPSATFDEAIHFALDALEQNDYEGFNTWTEKIRLKESPLKDSYEKWFLGLSLGYENHYDAALKFFLLAQNFKAHTLTERRLKAKIQMGIAGIYLGKGDYQKALALFRKSLMTWEAGVHAGTIYLNMGTLNRRNGDYTAAEEWFRSALSIKVNFIQVLSYASLGQLYMDQKDFPKARAALLHGYCISRKASEPRGKGEIFCNLGKYYKEIGRPEKAIQILKKGLGYTTLPSSKRTRFYILAELMDTYIALDQVRETKSIIESLKDERFNDGDILLIGGSLLTHAKKLIHEGCFSEAISPLNQCFRLLSPVSPTQELVSCCNLLFECYTQLREPFQADFFIRESKKLQKALKHIKSTLNSYS